MARKKHHKIKVGKKLFSPLASQRFRQVQRRLKKMTPEERARTVAKARLELTIERLTDTQYHIFNEFKNRIRHARITEELHSLRQSIEGGTLPTIIQDQLIMFINERMADPHVE